MHFHSMPCDWRLHALSPHALIRLKLPSLSPQAHARPPSAQRARPAPAAPAAPAAAAESGSRQQLGPPLQLVGTAALPAHGISAAPQAQPVMAAAASFAPSADAAHGSIAVPCSLPPAAGGHFDAAGSPAAWSSSAVEQPDASCGSPLSYDAAAADLAAAAEVEYEPQPVEQNVERSGGSLLNWMRPAGRRPAAQQSFTAGSSRPAAGRRADSQASSGAAQAAHAEALQPGRSSGSVRSFLRSAKSTPAAFPRAQAAAPAVHPAAQTSQVPAAPGSSSSHHLDLCSSVANWQRQRSGGSPWEDAGQQQQLTAAGAGSLDVEARSDSLLQWRLPARAPSSRQAAAGLQQPAPPPAAPGTRPSLARIGSATLMRTLSSLKRRVLGEGGADAALHEKDERAHGMVAAAKAEEALAWQIAAVRAAPEAAGGEVAAPSWQQQPAAVQSHTQGGWPGKPLLRVEVPRPAGMETSPQPSSPESPSKGAGRLDRLRQMSERRRVWSAPLQQQQQQQVVPAIDEGSPGGEPASGSGAASPGSPAGSPGQRPPSGDQSQRPGLQALKARARTARLHSGGSMSPSAAAGDGGGSGQYSMEALEDVFGPDRDHQPASPTAALWSPAKSAGAGSASPPKVSGAVRAGSATVSWMVALAHWSLMAPLLPAPCCSSRC